MSHIPLNATPVYGNLTAFANWLIVDGWNWFRHTSGVNYHGWETNVITYTFNGLSEQRQRDAATHWLQEWGDIQGFAGNEGASGLTFVYVPTGTAMLTIDDNHASGASTSITWTASGAITSARVHVRDMTGAPFNWDWELTAYGHEIGHALGLWHGGAYNALGFGETPDDQGGTVFTNDTRGDTGVSPGPQNPTAYNGTTIMSYWAGHQTHVSSDYPSITQYVDRFAVNRLYGPDIDTPLPSNVAAPSSQWRLVQDGDFDGDGDLDLLWHHNDGPNTIWELQGGNYVANHNLPNTSASYYVEAAADLEGADGDADIVWRHQDGSNVLWEIENNAYVVNHNNWFNVLIPA